jgi:hypothetical protein
MSNVNIHLTLHKQLVTASMFLGEKDKNRGNAQWCGPCSADLNNKTIPHKDKNVALKQTSPK